MANKYSWLLFDLDDTLLDYDATEHYALQCAFLDQGVQLNADIRKRYRVINKVLWTRLEEGELTVDDIRTKRFELLLEETSLDLDADKLSSTYLHSFGSKHFVIDGAFELLELLSDKLNMAVVTNGIRNTQLRRLRETGLITYFSHIVTSEDARYAKPDLRFFSYMSDVISCYDRERMLIIGDNLSSDITGGMGFGIDTCWYNPDKKEKGNILPKYEIYHLLELAKLLQ